MIYSFYFQSPYVYMCVCMYVCMYVQIQNMCAKKKKFKKKKIQDPKNKGVKMLAPGGGGQPKVIISWLIIILM